MFSHKRFAQTSKVGNSSYAVAARLEEIEANSRLRQEAAAEQAGRRKKEAEAEKALEQELQQHKETAREEFAGFLAGAAKGENPQHVAPL